MWVNQSRRSDSFRLDISTGQSGYSWSTDWLRFRRANPHAEWTTSENEEKRRSTKNADQTEVCDLRMVRWFSCTPLCLSPFQHARDQWSRFQWRKHVFSVPLSTRGQWTGKGAWDTPWLPLIDRMLPSLSGLELTIDTCRRGQGEKSSSCRSVDWADSKCFRLNLACASPMRKRILNDLFSFWRFIMLVIGWDDRTKSAPLPSTSLDASLVGWSWKNLTQCFSLLLSS